MNEEELKTLAKLIASIIKRENMDEQEANIFGDNLGEEVSNLMFIQYGDDLGKLDPNFEPDENLLDMFSEITDACFHTQIKTHPVISKKIVADLRRAKKGTDFR